MKYTNYATTKAGKTHVWMTIGKQTAEEKPFCLKHAPPPAQPTGTVISKEFHFKSTLPERYWEED